MRRRGRPHAGAPAGRNLPLTDGGKSGMVEFGGNGPQGPRSIRRFGLLIRPARGAWACDAGVLGSVPL